MIEGRHLSKSFGGHPVLKDASFTIGRGETVGLWGPSGIGKSTVAKLLCGILPPDEGEILLDGAVLASPKTPYDRRRGLRIQPVYQQPYAALDPRQKLSAGFDELIRYHRLAKTPEEKEALVSALLSSVGLDKAVLSRLPHQISGGEAQRVSVARCLLFEPRLLILDEATSMLDVSTQANVLGMIFRRMRAQSGSILLISHDRALVEHLSDRIYTWEDLHLREE